MKKPDHIELERHTKELEDNAVINEDFANSVINSMHDGVIVLNKKRYVLVKGSELLK